MLREFRLLWRLRVGLHGRHPGRFVTSAQKLAPLQAVFQLGNIQYQLYLQEAPCSDEGSNEGSNSSNEGSNSFLSISQWYHRAIPWTEAS